MEAEALGPCDPAGRPVAALGGLRAAWGVPAAAEHPPGIALP